MRILATTKNIKFPAIELLDSKNVRLDFKYRRIFNTGKTFLVKDFELKLGATQREDIVFSTDPKVLLLKDFLRNPTFFFARIFRTWEIEVNIDEVSALPVNFKLRNNQELLLWVSRQAVLSGIEPSDLDTSLELDYLRSPKKFDLMIRFVEDEYTKKYQMYDSKELNLVKKIQANHPSLSYSLHEDIEIISGRVAIKSNDILPVSNYRDETSVHFAGYLMNVAESDSYRVVRTHKTHEPVEKAIFVGFSSSWFHFLIECLPRLISIPSDLRNETPVILPSSTPKQIVTLCEAITNAKSMSLDIFEKVQVRRLYIGEETGVIDPLEFKFRIHAIRQAISEIRVKFPTQQEDLKIQKKLFIKRPKGLFRPLQNEKKLVTGLIRMGFTVISPERLEFYEVLRYMTNARFIVVESGAAMTNLLFTLPGTKILELYPGKGPMTFWPELASIAGAEVKKIMSIPCPIGPRGISRDGIYIRFRGLKKTIEEWEIERCSSQGVYESKDFR